MRSNIKQFIFERIPPELFTFSSKFTLAHILSNRSASVNFPAEMAALISRRKGGGFVSHGDGCCLLFLFTVIPFPERFNEFKMSSQSWLMTLQQATKTCLIQDGKSLIFTIYFNFCNVTFSLFYRQKKGSLQVP